MLPVVIRHLVLLVLYACASKGFTTAPHYPLQQRRQLLLYSARSALDSIEETVRAVCAKHAPLPEAAKETKQIRRDASKRLVLSLEGKEREAVAVAHRLRSRLDAFYRNRDCPRCWMQRAHCVCASCPPLVPPGRLPVRRIFVLMHHKEICMCVDTAKLLLAAFPAPVGHLVVGGIGPEYQANMAAMLDSLSSTRCLVLWPSDDAVTVDELVRAQPILPGRKSPSEDDEVDDDWNDTDSSWDLVVIDGTWAQARKLHASLPAGAPRVRLSEAALRELGGGEGGGREGTQLRRHPIAWREISTLEATRLLLTDLDAAAAAAAAVPPIANDAVETAASSRWGALRDYQIVADAAARRQLGPPRVSEERSKKRAAAAAAGVLVSESPAVELS